MSSAVVVGVSPTSGSPRALRFAAEEARLRGVPLRAVMAWRPPRPPVSPGGRPPGHTAGSAHESAVEAERALREFVATALGSEADVECVVVRGAAAGALLTTAEGATLLVVGEPRSGALEKVRTTWVAPQVMRKAPCPVVVMPAGIRPAD